ncbi:hypothetical protein [Bdellovibrio sp. GT3]|uniref:hypothetical protein n=1 Tax=Bdellovibrio sp. GT3 TaxID=3136282 RepID=UPI0030F1FAF4
MLQKIVLLLVSSLYLSLASARSDFNSMIESTNQEGQALQQNLARAVSSENSFSADVVSVKRARAYNPVTFNPLVENDGEVEVIVKDRESK